MLNPFRKREREPLLPNLEFMIIRRTFEYLVIGKKIPDNEFEKTIQTITKKVNPVFKKLNSKEFFNYWISNSDDFDQTFYGIRDYLRGNITLDEFKAITYEWWSNLTQRYEESKISNEYNQHNIWVIGYFALLLKKLFDNYSEPEMEQDLEKIKQNLLPTLKDVPESLESAKSEVDNIVKKTITATKNYFGSN